jgi:hypothetical protein
MKMKYKVIDYSDVWGNDEDGYVVNNQQDTGLTVEFNPHIVSDYEIICKLKNIGYLLSNLEEDKIEINSSDDFFIELFRKRDMCPVCLLSGSEVTMKYYYDFGYFFDRKHSGSIEIITDEELDTENIDECVNYAITNGLLEDEYIDNIIYVTRLTEQEARDMGFEI